MSDGTVQNRFIPVEIDELELHRIHNLLDDVIEGRTLGDLRAFFAERMGAERVLRDALRKRAYEIAGAAMEGAGGAPVVDVVIEGRHKLLQRPEFSQGSEMHKIVAALDEETQIVALLDAAAAARGTAIFVGKEAGDLADGQLAIVGASYAVQHRVHGSVGVIGPTRMDYPSVVPLVTATAHAMSEARTKPPKE
jgi:heat-inducible transcriptional repressor